MADEQNQTQPIGFKQKFCSVEPILYLLFLGIVIFAVMLFAADFVFKDDGQVFQVIAGLLTAFSGAFFMRVNNTSGQAKQ